MTYEQIEAVVPVDQFSDTVFEISFRIRNCIRGVFIKTSDYRELSRKNLWRIVRGANIAEYRKTHNENLTRIFNGIEFTKLEMQP